MQGRRRLIWYSMQMLLVRWRRIRGGRMRLLISIRFLMCMNGDVHWLLVTWFVYTSGLYTYKKSAQYVHGTLTGTTHNSIFNKSIVHPKYCPKKRHLHILHSLSSLRRTSISSLKHRAMQDDGIGLQSHKCPQSHNPECLNWTSTEIFAHSLEPVGR